MEEEYEEGRFSGGVGTPTMITMMTTTIKTTTTTMATDMATDRSGEGGTEQMGITR